MKSGSVYKRFILDRAFRFSILADRGVYRAMSDKRFLEKKYRLIFHEKLNLDAPETFSEKLQWLKLYDHNPAYTTMVDKYAARDYIAGKVGEKYLIPLAGGPWKHFDEIDFHKLPGRFVLKCNHDSGGVVICADEASFDKEKARVFLEKRLRKNYYNNGREWPYKNVQPLIYAEEYVENNRRDGLHDYKVWCFNGVPRLIQYVSGRAGARTTEAFYDFGWRRQPFTFHNPLCGEEVKRPLHLDQMEEAAGVLSRDIPFLRVDFYVMEDEKIYIGELTFFPMSGLEHFKPAEYDRKLGEWIGLPVEGK